MSPQLPRAASGASLDRERLLAFSSLLRDGSTAFEFALQGGSMGSVLPDGSRIRVRFVPQDELVADQIVAYVAEDRMVVHRLVRFAKWHYETYVIARGDATVCCDLPVPASSVIGIVTEYCTTGPWQPVGPARARWFGFAWAASAISSVVGWLVGLHPRIAIWTARRMIRIHRLAMRLARFAKRHTGPSSLNRVRIQSTN
jgi:hypothetical protein